MLLDTIKNNINLVLKYILTILTCMLLTNCYAGSERHSYDSNKNYRSNSAYHSNAGYNNYSTDTRMTESIFLDPEDLNYKKIYVQILQVHDQHRVVIMESTTYDQQLVLVQLSI